MQSKSNHTNKINIMENINIQALIAQEIAKAIASQTPPARDYFAEADALNKQSQELRNLAINGLAVTSDETFAEIRASKVSGVATELTKTINKAGGTRLTDEQKAELKLAREEHKEQINQSDFKSQLSAIIADESTELDSYKQGLPNKEGKIKRTLAWF